MPVVLARAAPPASYLWQNGTRRKDLTRLCLRRPDKLGSLTESGFKKIAETFNALGAKIAQDAATARPGSRRRRTSFHRWRNIFAPAIRAPDRLDGRGENIDRGLLPQRRRRRQEGQDTGPLHHGVVESGETAAQSLQLFRYAPLPGSSRVR
jgi:hypothetical protein